MKTLLQRISSFTKLEKCFWKSQPVGILVPQMVGILSQWVFQYLKNET